MSHETPIYGYEWFQKVENALKEMRVGYDFTVVRDGAHGVFNNVLTFVSNHQSELLYSFSAVSLGIVAIYLLYQWKASQNALQSLSEEHKSLEWRLVNYRGMLERARTSVANYQHKCILLEEELEESRSDYNEMEELKDDMESSRDFWQAKVSEVMAERNQMEEERDDLESDRDDMESDRDYWQEKFEDKDSDYDELQDRVDTLESMVDTYKALVSELETTTELKLAA